MKRHEGLAGVVKGGVGARLGESSVLFNGVGETRSEPRLYLMNRRSRQRIELIR